MRPRPVVVLLAVTVLWASTFIVTKDVVREQAPLGFLSFRFGLAAVVLLALAWRRFPLSRAALRDGVVLGVLNANGLVLQVIGQGYTTASKSAFVTSLNTPLVPLVALLLYRTRPTRVQLVAVALASAGLVLLTWPGTGARWNTGDLLTGGCAIIYAVTIVEIARRTPGKDVWGLTAVQTATAAALFLAGWAVSWALVRAFPLDRLPEVLRWEARPFSLQPRVLIEMVYMALVCTVVTFLAQTWAMARMSAIHAAIVFALEPVIATGMAVGVEGSAEWPGARGAVGAGVVMLGVVVSEMRWNK